MTPSPVPTDVSSLQSLCEQGQQALLRTDYLRAEAILVEAERLAARAEDFDTLARLYMPLQEARRQRRQRCGEGIVRLDLLADGPDQQPDPDRLAELYPRGQLLVGGWGTVAPAARLREIQRDRNQFAETIMAAVYPTAEGERAIVLVPLAGVELPAVDSNVTFAQLRERVPSYCPILSRRDLPSGERRGTWQTYAEVMSLWERLHAPFLAAADMGVKPIDKIEGYRRTIEVDYACELAHQKLSNVAHQLARERRI